MTVGMTIVRGPSHLIEPQNVINDRVTGKMANGQVSHRSKTLADHLTNEWAHDLHYGSFGGLTTRVLYLIACLIVDLLYITGISMWIIKHRKHRNCGPSD